MNFLDAKIRIKEGKPSVVVGEGNILSVDPGVVSSLKDGQKVILGIRPQDVLLAEDGLELGYHVGVNDEQVILFLFQCFKAMNLVGESDHEIAGTCRVAHGVDVNVGSPEDQVKKFKMYMQMGVALQGRIPTAFIPIVEIHGSVLVGCVL